MMETNVKEDRRVRRTKKLLMQSLMQLMQSKQIKDITVRELADTADVNRGTFYLYYRDVFDMLEKIENEMFDKFDALLLSHPGETVIHQTLPFLKDLFTFAEENQEMCRVLLNRNGDMTFLERLNSVVFEKCREEFHMLFQDANDDEFETRYNFVVFGCIGMIRSWVNNGCKQDAMQMAGIANQLISRGAIS